MHEINSIHYLFSQDNATTATYYLQCCLMKATDKQFVGRMAPTATIPLVSSLQAGAVQCNILEVWFMYFACMIMQHVTLHSTSVVCVLLLRTQETTFSVDYRANSIRYLSFSYFVLVFFILICSLVYCWLI